MAKIDHLSTNRNALKNGVYNSKVNLNNTGLM